MKIYSYQRENFEQGNMQPIRYSVNEWFHHNVEQYEKIENSGIKAEKLIERSDRIRERVKALINKQKDETEWRFNKRIHEIDFVRVELERVRKLLQDELDALTLMQERIQAEINYVKVNALEIVEKCIRFREGRQEMDLIHDEVETGLEMEAKKIKEAEALLQRTLEQAKESKRELRASLYLLNKDVEDKLISLGIEMDCLNLKETNLDIYVYEGDQTLDNGTVSLDEWKRYSEEIMKSSNRKIHDARIFQTHVKSILEEVIFDLREQYIAVNDMFQRRIADVKDAKERLESYLYEIVRQVNDMTRNISELENSIKEKEGFLALAQTRLAKRSNRPRVELVRDEVEACLVREILDIRSSVSELQKTHAEAQFTLRCLLKTRVQLEEEINVKTNSIKIDEVDCMTLRQSINYNNF